MYTYILKWFNSILYHSLDQFDICIYIYINNYTGCLWYVLDNKHNIKVINYFASWVCYFKSWPDFFCFFKYNYLKLSLLFHKLYSKALKRQLDLIYMCKTVLQVRSLQKIRILVPYYIYIHFPLKRNWLNHLLKILR